MKKKIFKYDDRLVRFAVDIISFCKTLPKDFIGKYYYGQILRSSGSSALNYGEAQGTNTKKDFIHKMTIVIKELRETKMALKILDQGNIGNQLMVENLTKELEELISIAVRMVLNKKNDERI